MTFSSGPEGQDQLCTRLLEDPGHRLHSSLAVLPPGQVMLTWHQDLLTQPLLACFNCIQNFG